MDLTTLLTFIPLGIGIAWLFNLIFSKDLASQSLGKIISYFLGVLIIILVVGFFLDTMLPSWLNTRYQRSRSNIELQQFINTVIGDATDGGGQAVVLPAPTPVPILIQPTAQPPVAGNPNPGGITNENPSTRQQGTAGTHVVQPGETLSRIAATYNVDLNALRSANNRMGNDFIYAGEVLVIPQQ